MPRQTAIPIKIEIAVINLLCRKEMPPSHCKSNLIKIKIWSNELAHDLAFKENKNAIAQHAEFFKFRRDKKNSCSLILKIKNLLMNKFDSANIYSTSRLT